MDVVSGKDRPASSAAVGPLLAAIRRLRALADEAGESEAIFRALGQELLAVPGAEEVHVHQLGAGPAGEDLVDVYLQAADGRLSYLVGRAERPPGVSWVARSGRSFLAADAEEFAASVPRLTATGELSCALLLPVAEREEAEAVVLLVRREAEVYDQAAVEAASALAEQAATSLALSRARSEAGTDPVTGCLNHRAMRRRLQEEIGRALRSGAPLSCLLIDLDDFKAVNDRHGHPAGDAMLREVVQALVGEFRSFDRVARYGGDEFVVILPNADLDSASAAAARALAHLREVSPHVEEQGVSASIGVAQWQAPMSTDDLLGACDNALLQAKRQGKGRVTRAPNREL